MHDVSAEARCCVICRHLLYADEMSRYACYPCQERGTGMLRAVPGLYRQTAGLLQPGTGGGDGRVTGSKSAPLPCSEAVLSLRARGGLVTILATWEDAVRDELGYTAATFRGSLEQTLGGVVTFLANNAPWIYGKFPFVDEYHAELRQLHGQARALVTGERPERRVPVVCGCGTVLKVTVSSPGEKCRGCSTQYDREQLHRLPLAERHAA